MEKNRNQIRDHRHRCGSSRPNPETGWKRGTRLIPDRVDEMEIPVLTEDGGSGDRKILVKETDRSPKARSSRSSKMIA